MGSNQLPTLREFPVWISQSHVPIGTEWGNHPASLAGLLRPWRSSNGDNQTAEIKVEGWKEGQQQKGEKERREGGERKDEHLVERERSEEGGPERKLSKSCNSVGLSKFLFIFFMYVIKSVLSILDHTKPILCRETSDSNNHCGYFSFKVRWDLIRYRIKHISYWFFQPCKTSWTVIPLLQPGCLGPQMLTWQGWISPEVSRQGEWEVTEEHLLVWGLFTSLPSKYSLRTHVWTSLNHGEIKSSLLTTSAYPLLNQPRMCFMKPSAVCYRSG